ncbi:MAG: hypothetical protein ABSD31_03225 [Candidatus Binataceae bacterium]|jgi:predicted DNA-binding transcriptional regulator AlpA
MGNTGFESITTTWLEDKDVLGLMGVNRHTLAIWQAKGKFPKPSIRIGNRKLYRRAMIEAWLEQRASETEVATA